MSIWTIKCDGGCGREMHTDKPTVLWSVTTCPDCEREDEARAEAGARDGAGR